ncbi:MAG: hypothetical protein O3C23_02430 [bacterium]|nr:hypothetical protein [bacterium]
MKIFEFSFNPKKNKNRIFNVYSHEPQSAKEKVRGSLYVIGELDNALDFNTRFLKRLAGIIQSEYYGSLQKTASSALKIALKKANAFLREESKRGNVDWLGNLHLAVFLLITIKEKKTMFYSTKTGNVQISLMRQGMMTDVGKNVEKSASQLGTVFENLVSTSLMPGDSVIAITKEVFDIFIKEKSFKEIGVFTETKQFHEFLAKRQRILKKISGILVSFVIEEEEAKRSPINKSLLPYLPLLRAGIQKQISFLKAPLMLKKGIKSKAQKGKKQCSFTMHPFSIKKEVILILLFFTLLLLGVLFFG